MRRKRATIAIEERKQRALVQRMYLVERTMKTNNLQEFAVLGSTGNVYKVLIDNQPSCNCPDWKRKMDVCKHLIFVFLRVLNEQRHLYYQKNLTDEELEYLASLSPAETAPKEVVEAYKELQKEPHESIVERKLLDRCMICFEDMTIDEDLVWCKQQCGVNFHQSCMGQWLKVQSSHKCPHCRTSWESSSADYVNLGEVANMPKWHYIPRRRYRPYDF